MPARRFPPPWTIDEANNACFIVRDSAGRALGYFYFEEEPGRPSAAKPLSCSLENSPGEIRLSPREASQKGGIAKICKNAKVKEGS